MKTIRIRPMQWNDVMPVAALEALCFALPWSQRAFEHELRDNPAARCWVAEKISQPVPQVIGMIVIWLVLDEAHIGTMAVHPDFRCLGIGQRLLGTAIEHARLCGMNLALLEVRASNIPAQRLYQSFGFETVGIRRKYYQDNAEDALLMTLDFNQYLASQSKLPPDETPPSNGS